MKDINLQVRTSYLPNEILWGYRFEHSCVSYDKQEAKYAVSITNLNKIRADNTPRYIQKLVLDIPSIFFTKGQIFFNVSNIYHISLY